MAWYSTPRYRTTPLFLVAALVILATANATDINVTALIMGGFALWFVFAVVIAEIRDWRSRRWQFSLRTLLVTMTVAAALLGIVVWAVK